MVMLGSFLSWIAVVREYFGSEAREKILLSHIRAQLEPPRTEAADIWDEDELLEEVLANALAIDEVSDPVLDGLPRHTIRSLPVGRVHVVGVVRRLPEEEAWVLLDDAWDVHAGWGWWRASRSLAGGVVDRDSITTPDRGFILHDGTGGVEVSAELAEQLLGRVSDEPQRYSCSERRMMPHLLQAAFLSFCAATLLSILFFVAGVGWSPFHGVATAGVPLGLLAGVFWLWLKVGSNRGQWWVWSIPEGAIVQLVCEAMPRRGERFYDLEMKHKRHNPALLMLHSDEQGRRPYIHFGVWSDNTSRELKQVVQPQVRRLVKEEMLSETLHWKRTMLARNLYIYDNGWDDEVARGDYDHVIGAPLFPPE